MGIISMCNENVKKTEDSDNFSELNDKNINLIAENNNSEDIEKDFDDYENEIIPDISYVDEYYDDLYEYEKYHDYIPRYDA